MALSAQTYQGDGVNTDFVLSFTLGYISTDHIYVYVKEDGEDEFELIDRTTYTFINSGGSVRLATAPPADSQVLVRRIVPNDKLIHDYENGALLVEKNLDQSNLQAVMLQHESIDGFISKGAGQELDMSGFRIINLADPINDQDAMTYGAVKTSVDSCAADAASASVSAAAALASEQEAQAQAQILINALLPKGNWDASGGTFPPDPVLLPNGNTRADIYNVSGAGVMDNGVYTMEVYVGDQFYWNPVDLVWVRVLQTFENVVKQTSDTGGAVLPSGTTAERPTDQTKPYIRNNEDTQEAEFFNPATLEWGPVGGGGLPPLIVKDADFTVERKKGYGIDLSLSDVVVANVPDGLSEDDWFVIVDTGNAFDPVAGKGCVIQLGTEEFVITDEDRAFFASELNSMYAFQKKGGVWVLSQSSYGQDATWAVDKIENGYSDWVVIGSPGAPAYENTFAASPSFLGMRYRFKDSRTIEVVGRTLPSSPWNTSAVIFTFPPEIAERILLSQQGPAYVGVSSGASDGNCYISVNTSGEFTAVENTSDSSIYQVATSGFTIVLDEGN